jgi:hypothetical protein
MASLALQRKSKDGIDVAKVGICSSNVRELQVLESLSLHTAYGVRLMKIRKEFVQNLFKK